MKGREIRQNSGDNEELIANILTPYLQVQD
jgi:hypothetical protein